MDTSSKGRIETEDDVKSDSTEEDIEVESKPTLAPELQEGLPDSLPGFDIKTALARLGGSEDLFIRIAESFAESYRDADKKLTELFEKEDYETAHREAHSIKGVVGNIGAMDLYEGAREIEAIAKKAEEGEKLDQQATRLAVDEFAGRLRVVIQSLDSIIPVTDEIEEAKGSSPEVVQLDKEQRNGLVKEIREACESGDFFALKNALKDYPTNSAEIIEVKSLVAKFDSEKLSELADSLS
ncbi:MAG: Hpt domain-containing protein [Verrucomicrobia bacterium]|nr:Hpt domain-containing protein [Verrucomicrobiota bacterium]